MLLNLHTAFFGHVFPIQFKTTAEETSLRKKLIESIRKSLGAAVFRSSNLGIWMKFLKFQF